MGVELLAIAAAVSAAATVGSLAYSVSKGTPDIPKPAEVPKPQPPPAAPPPPAPVPPPPTDTEADAGVVAEKRKRQQRYGVQQTLLANPLGGGSDLPSPGAGGRTVLGG